MSRRGKRYTSEEIVIKLREADVLLSQGLKISNVCKQIGVGVETYSRWKNEFGGLKLPQAKKLKELEKENDRLKKIVADLSLDNAMLKEVSKGNY